MSTLTEGSAKVVRLLAPRVPDGFLISGAVAFGVGVYKINPAAIWMYVGCVCIWTAFAIAANQKREGGQ